MAAGLVWLVDPRIPRMIATQDAVIIGRRGCDEWVGFWPGSEIEPFATFINGVAKHVATSTPLEPQWTNAHVIDGDLVEFARRLKDGPGGDIGVHGSISVAQALLAGGVVDELRLVIAPSIAGGGRRLLDGLPSLQLESIRSEISSTGYRLVDYRVIRWALPCRTPRCGSRPATRAGRDHLRSAAAKFRQKASA